jgi:hypothetical protein
VEALALWIGHRRWNCESQASESKRNQKHGGVQPEIQGIALNFAPPRFIRHLRQAVGAPSIKD